jgi:hypothetical protein
MRNEPLPTVWDLNLLLCQTTTASQETRRTKRTRHEKTICRSWCWQDCYRATINAPGGGVAAAGLAFFVAQDAFAGRADAAGLLLAAEGNITELLVGCKEGYWQSHC